MTKSSALANGGGGGTIKSPVVDKVYARRYHFNSFELVASRPGHHVDTELHARRHVEEKRRRAVQVQFHGPLLVHGGGVTNVQCRAQPISLACWSLHRRTGRHVISDRSVTFCYFRETNPNVRTRVQTNNILWTTHVVSNVNNVITADNGIVFYSIRGIKRREKILWL